MDWTQGYTAHWRIYRVNVDTWADGEELRGCKSVSIDRDGTGTAPLLESGTVSMDGAQDFGEEYLRIVMYAEQDGGAQRVDVATLLCNSTSGSVNYGGNACDLNGQSVLYPASVRRVLSGTYAPAGSDGARWCADMLRSCIAAPVTVSGGFTLDSNIVFAIGTPYLECVWGVLDAGGYIMQIAGDGTVQIMPNPTEAALLLDDANAKLLHQEIKYALDWSNVPNRYTAIDGMEVAIAVNDDAASPASTVTRGYVFDTVDTSPKRINGETLAQYAERRLEESSTIPDVRTYTREYWPAVLPGSLVRGTLASVDMEGALRVVTQSLTCGAGITVNEKAQREVKTWTR